MTPTQDSFDDLGMLWRSSEPRLDPVRLAADAMREQAGQRRLINGLVAAGLLLLAGVIWLEADGRIVSWWLLPILIAASLIRQVAVSLRVRRRAPDVAAMGPDALLRYRLGQARVSLRNGRILCVGLPFGIVSGLAAGWIGVVPSRPDTAPGFVGAVLIAVGITLALAFVIAGWRTAQRATDTIKVLEGRLAPEARA
jgi:hypothetical protein